MPCSPGSRARAEETSIARIAVRFHRSIGPAKVTCQLAQRLISEAGMLLYRLEQRWTEVLGADFGIKLELMLAWSKRPVHFPVILVCRCAYLGNSAIAV